MDMDLMKIKFVKKYKKLIIVWNKIKNNLLNVNCVNKIIILVKIFVSKFKIKFQIVSIMKVKKNVQFVKKIISFHLIKKIVNIMKVNVNSMKKLINIVYCVNQVIN